MQIGGRVKYRTIGGWYNSGIIRYIDKDSYLIEVDELGCQPLGYVHIPLTFYIQTKKKYIVPQESEDKE